MERRGRGEAYTASKQKTLINLHTTHTHTHLAQQHAVLNVAKPGKVGAERGVVDVARAADKQFAAAAAAAARGGPRGGRPRRLRHGGFGFDALAVDDVVADLRVWWWVREKEKRE